MFYAFQRSAHTEDFTPSLQKIQLWAHLKGVPFDLIYDAGLSHIAGQIGEPKETDDWTLSLSSISVAHVKVEIDTTVPLPSKVEVGRMNGTFVTVEVEYPWIPPSCAHCKEVGHIQRHCPLLPPPSPPIPKQKPPPPAKPQNSGPRNQPSPSQSSKKPPPANKFCFSCRATGHLMNNCPKGPADWTLVNRQISHPSTSTIPSSVTPFSPPPLSSSQPKPTLPQPPLPPTVSGEAPSSSISPPSLTPPIDAGSDQGSMEIDTSPQPKDPSFVCSDGEPETLILVLPAVFKDRPIHISTSDPPAKSPSILSLNPFHVISPTLDTSPIPVLSPQTPPVAPNPESSPSGETQPQS